MSKTYKIVVDNDDLNMLLDGKTNEELVRILKRGEYDVRYRNARNKREYAKYKAWKATSSK